MRLTNYRECSFREKRAVLRVFWSRRTDESEKITRAAREYAPYALGLVTVITAEMAAITAVLVAHADRWAAAACTATALAAGSLGWTALCLRHVRGVTTD